MDAISLKTVLLGFVQIKEVDGLALLAITTDLGLDLRFFGCLHLFSLGFGFEECYKSCRPHRALVVSFGACGLDLVAS